MDVSTPSKIRKTPKGCWLMHWGKSVWQLIRLIIDMPINIPSVLIPLDSKKIKDGKNHAQILRNSVNEYKLQQLAEKKTRDMSLDKTSGLN